MITGDNLRKAREAQGIGLDRLADRIGRTKGHLSKVERGVDGRRVTPALVRDYEQALGTPIPHTTTGGAPKAGELLPLTDWPQASTTTARPQPEGAVAQKPALMLAGGSAMPELFDSSVMEWSGFARVTQLLASQRQMIAPEALLGLVEAHRECLSMLYRQARTDPLRGQLGKLLGEASIVASRLWSAQGNRPLAIAHCAYARQLADRLNNPVLGALARIFESNLHSDAATLIGRDGDLALGLRLLQEAASVQHLLSPAARARIWAEQAQAFAALQMRAECQDALDQARAAVALVTEIDRTGLFSDWTSSRLRVYEGTCLLILGQPRKAVDVLTTATHELGTDPANVNVALAAEVDLASAHANAGDLDAGCTALAGAYLRLTAIGNHRGLDRARRARQRLQPWAHERLVRDLDEAMATD